jgi:hypothetical protein
MSVVNLSGGNSVATADNIRTGKKLRVVWVKEGGMVFPTIGLRYEHSLSDVQQIADIAGEFLNERDIFQSGYTSAQTNDGVNFSTTMTLEGDSLEEVASLIGQVIRTYPSLEWGRDYGRMGHLVMMSFDEDYNLKVSDVLFDVGIKLTSIPGTQDGEITRQIELYTKQGINPASVWGETGVSEGGVPSFEMWWDNGTTVTNLTAPNGVLTAFTLGYGNKSYATNAAPDILIVNADGATDFQKYFYFVRVDGDDVNPNDCTFNPTTKVLTFTTAPADGAKLEVAYMVDRAGAGVLGQPAHLHGTSAAGSTNSNFMYDWKTVQRL